MERELDELDGGEGGRRLRSRLVELSARAEQARERWGPPQELQRWANRQKADWAEHRPLFQDLQITCEEAAPDGSGNSLKGLSSPPRTDAPAAQIVDLDVHT